MSGDKEEIPRAGDSIKVYEKNYPNYNTHSSVREKRSNADLGSEIRNIERKIRMCQKKIDEDKRKKL